MLHSHGIIFLTILGIYCLNPFLCFFSAANEEQKPVNPPKQSKSKRDRSNSLASNTSADENVGTPTTHHKTHSAVAGKKKQLNFLISTNLVSRSYFIL
jgi:hypothetical protein